VKALRALPFALLITIGSTSVLARSDELRRDEVRRAEFRAASIATRESSGSSSTTKLACFAIRPGDTAARLALRFTGNKENRNRTWFQIIDPVTATVIPKSSYDEIEPGWHVCVASEMLRPGRPQPEFLPVSTSGAAAPQTSVQHRAPGIAAIDPGGLWWVVPLFVAASGAGFAWGWKRIDERRARVEVLRAFGEKFIREFERPLRRNATSPPIKSRVRFAPMRLRVDILIAPDGGRTYPNLVDHKRNVEYDVERVMRLLRDASFVNGPLYAQGSWVVVPCRFQTDRQQEGAS
jgi:hypothetical protein